MSRKEEEARRAISALGVEYTLEVLEALEVYPPEALASGFVVSMFHADTFEQCMEHFHGCCRANSNSEVQVQALAKALSKADTYEQCMEVTQESLGGSEVHRQAWEKGESLLKEELECASYFQEYLAIYRRALPGSEVWGQALTKAMSSATTVNECIEVHRGVPTSSREYFHALAKAMSKANSIDGWKICFDNCSKGSVERANCIRAIAELVGVEEISGHS